MVLKYFLVKSLMLIYESHKDFSKHVLVIYEDTKGKTRYKCCKSTTDVEKTYNGFGYYIITVQYFYEDGYHTLDYISKQLFKSDKKSKKDIVKIIDKVINLFN